MANTYESKFKGVEVDEGVNIARNLTGTGGIEVKKTATGTINATVTIDGSGVKITPVSGTGTSTTDVMSQKAVTDELGKKQDKLTVSSNVHINSLTVAATSAADGLYFTNETGAGISYRILNAAGSGTAPLARLTVPNDIAGKTQTIATREYVNAHSSSYNPGSGINISGNTISLAERIMVDNITLGNYSSGNVILLPQSGASGNVYFPKYGGYLATTNDIPAPGITGVNIYSGGKRGTVTNITFDSDIYNTPTIGGPTGGAQDWLIMPLPKTKTINGQSILGSGDITVGGGSAGVSSIGGKTGAITLSTGLAMSGQQLVNKVKVYTSGNYLCIDTN